MSNKHTGVFVRLPLSEVAQELLVDAAAFGKPDDSHDKAILAIGTPVTGGDIPVITTLGTLRDPIPCVRQSDAQAQMAALEAEVVRLRGALESLENANNNLCFMRSSDTYQSMMRDGCGDFLAKLDDARRAAREALKGGAA
jgi:hypothetical protein